MTLLLKGENNMTNFQVYRKTLVLSGVQFLVDLAILLVFGGLIAGGAFIGIAAGNVIIGLVVGLVLAIIAGILGSYLLSNRVKAAHIAMITKGVNENQLPDHVVKSGFAEVRGRFTSLTAFFFVTNAIKGIFRQVGRGINRIGTAIGGDAGNSITSAIDSAIQILIGYLCDCCLGWVIFRKDENTAKAACEGAVIFFKHGKTLIRNIGRIFGMGLLSLLLVGGLLFAAFFGIFSLFPSAFATLSQEVAKALADGGTPEPIDPVVFTVIAAAVGAVILWSTLHSVLVRPFILTGVLRNFMESGKADMPKESDFEAIAAKSPRFRKLQETI